MVSLVFCDILQLPHTVISSSEKLTHPIVYALYKYNTQISVTINQDEKYVSVKCIFLFYNSVIEHWGCCVMFPYPVLVFINSSISMMFMDSSAVHI